VQPPTNCYDFPPFPITADRARVRFQFWTSYTYLYNIYLLQLQLLQWSRVLAAIILQYIRTLCCKYPLDIISFYPFLSCLLWILNRTILITIIFPFVLFLDIRRRPSDPSYSFVYGIYIIILYRYYIIMLNKFQQFVCSFEQLLFTHAPQLSSFSKQYNIISRSYNL